MHGQIDAQAAEHGSLFQSHSILLSLQHTVSPMLPFNQGDVLKRGPAHTCLCKPAATALTQSYAVTCCYCSYSISKPHLQPSILLLALTLSSLEGSRYHHSPLPAGPSLMFTCGKP